MIIMYQYTNIFNHILVYISYLSVGLSEDKFLDIQLKLSIYHMQDSSKIMLLVQRILTYIPYNSLFYN